MADKVRIPREEAERFVRRLEWQMRAWKRPWMIGGSWRRGAAAIGDIDVMVVTESGTFADFRFPPCFEAASGDTRRKNGVIRAVDGSVIPAQFWACEAAQRGAMAMFITGPGPFNVMQRAKAKRKGYKLSQYGLFKDDRMLPLFTERDIYAELGWDWVEPEARDAAK